MQAYRIVDWKRRYEIKIDKREAAADTPDEQLRKQPHQYIRWKVFGHKLGHKYRVMVKKAWRPGEINELAIIGLFGKLLELAGDQKDPRFRGWILDEDQRPMTAGDIAELLDIHEVGRLTEALAVMIDLEWLERLEYPTATAPAACEIVDKLPLLQKLQGAAKIASVSCKPLINENENENENKNKNESVAKNATPISFRLAIRQIIPARNKQDLAAFDNLNSWLDKQILLRRFTDDIKQQVLEYATDASRQGDKPIAYFFDILKRELGYEPNRWVLDKIGKY